MRINAFSLAFRQPDSASESKMKFETLEIKGCFLIKPTITRDERGFFIKPFVASEFQAKSLKTNFVEYYYSRSKRKVIRGMHIQSPPHDYSKLVSCISGVVIDVLLDLRKNSDYGRYLSIELSMKNGHTLYIPQGVAHGFMVKSRSATMIYNVTSEYKPDKDIGIKWDSFGFDWSIQDPIISERDRSFATFQRFITPF